MVRAAVVAELAPVLASGELGVRLAVPPGEAAGAVAGSANGLLVELAFPAGTTPDEVALRARVVADRLGGNAELREVFDGTLQISTTVRGRPAG